MISLCLHKFKVDLKPVSAMTIESSKKQEENLAASQSGHTSENNTKKDFYQAFNGQLHKIQSSHMRIHYRSSVTVLGVFRGISHIIFTVMTKGLVV